MPIGPSAWSTLLLCGVALVCLYVGFRFWTIARTLADTAISRVRSASQGYIELYGRAENPANQPQKAPLTGRPCVWWSYRIECRRGEGRAAHWECINSGASVAPFLLRDETGACLVDPRGADIKPSDGTTWYGGLPWPTGMTVTSSVAGLGDQYRYSEHRLYEYDSVCALGEFRTLGGLASGNLDTDVAALLHRWKEDPQALMKRFDTDGNGVLSAQEWEQARAAARAQVLSQQAQAPTLNVICKPSDARPYLLAASDPTHLARRYRWQAAAGLAGFLLALAVLGNLLLQR